MDLARFKEEEIKVVFRRYTCPRYPQQFLKETGFIPNLSTIDLLFNCGEESLNILINGGRIHPLAIRQPDNKSRIKIYNKGRNV